MADSPSNASHVKCGHCQGVFPADYAECPYCGASVESYGALGRLVESILPKDRPMTKVVAGVAIAVFLLVGLVAGTGAFFAPSSYTVIHFGAMFPPYIIEGEWWRLVTAIFLHGGIVHIGFNVYAVWVVGPLIENSFGKLRFLLAFLLTGILSIACSFAYGFVAIDVAQAIPIPFLFDPDTATSIARSSVGMSGALTGLIGVGVGAGHKVKNEAGTRVRNALLRWMGFIVLFGLVVPGIDNAAHFGGFLAGLVLGLIFPLKSSASRIGGWVYAAATALVVGLTVAAFVLQGLAMPLQYPADREGYGQGVFGFTIREPDPSDSSLTAAPRACTAAYNELVGQRGDPAPDTITRAVAACDEARYVNPSAPEAYLRSAYAYHLDGDDAEACRRLRSGQMLLDYFYSKRDGHDIRAAVSDVERRMEMVRNEAGCRLP